MHQPYKPKVAVEIDSEKSKQGLGDVYAEVGSIECGWPLLTPVVGIRQAHGWVVSKRCAGGPEEEAQRG